MSHVPHDLNSEFPSHADKIHALKGKNAHFAKMVEAYQDCNHQIHRMETNIEPTTDEVLEKLKKQRLHLKDEIAAQLV